MEPGPCEVEVVGRMRDGASGVLAVREVREDRLGVAWVLEDGAGAQFLSDALSGLEHPALARHMGLTEAGGRVALLTEPLPVRTLKDQLDEHGPLPQSAALQLGLRLCEGLALVHAAGLVHGNVSPATVHMDGAEVVLADFREARFDADPQLDLAALADVIAAASGEGASPELQEILARCRGLGELFPDAAAVGAALMTAADKLGPDDTWPSLPPASRPIELTDSLEREGDVVGSYVLQRLLGEGSMGRVFAARHVRLGRMVALKILRPEHSRSREIVQRFFQEARTVNEIDHRHIVEIFDFVEEPLPDGRVRAFCVMELLDGRGLSELMRGAPIPLARTLTIVRQLCLALAAAHRVGVVHRDVKPDNVFVADRLGEDFVKVVDFGVAKLVRPMGELPTGTTVDGAIIGTPAYMSPEQAQGLEVDSRADVHAVGVVLYELLTGAVPYTATRFGALAAQIISQTPPPLPDRTPAGDFIPGELAELVMQMLAKDARARPASLVTVEQLLASLAPARAPRGRGRRMLVGALCGMALAGTLFGLRAQLRPVPAVSTVVPLQLPVPHLQLQPPAKAAPVAPPLQETMRSLRPVNLRVSTTPEGAQVFRADTGEQLGTTPLSHAFATAQPEMPLRIELAGHSSVARTVKLEQDASVDVALEPSRHHRTHHRHGRKVLDPFAE